MYTLKVPYRTHNYNVKSLLFIFRIYTTRQGPDILAVYKMLIISALRLF
jgi:hypothetical protein